MKYTLEGFSQARLVELGMDCVDAVILRWLVDFSATGKMRYVDREDGQRLYWVRYDAVIADLPVLRIKSKDRLAKRLQTMVSAGVLIHRHVRTGGSFSYFGIGPAYESLLRAPSDFKVGPPQTLKSDPSDFKVGANDSSSTDPSTSNNSFSAAAVTEAASDSNGNGNPECPCPEFSKYPKAFEEFWAAYPRKAEKKDAYAKWRVTLREDGATTEILIAAAGHYGRVCDGREEKYIKHAATFLGPKEPWRDHVGGNSKIEDTQQSRDQIARELLGRS